MGRYALAGGESGALLTRPNFVVPVCIRSSAAERASPAVAHPQVNMSITHFRLLLVIALAVASFPSTAFGQAKSAADLLQQIDSLERRIEVLERRLAQLESPSRAEPARDRTPIGNARDIANWRKLRRGMSMQAVRELLGEPSKVSASVTFTIWDYPNFSSVTFDDDRVTAWSEPDR